MENEMFTKPKQNKLQLIISAYKHLNLFKNEYVAYYSVYYNSYIYSTFFIELENNLLFLFINITIIRIAVITYYRLEYISDDLILFVCVKISHVKKQHILPTI